MRPSDSCRDHCAGRRVENSHRGIVGALPPNPRPAAPASVALSLRSFFGVSLAKLCFWQLLAPHTSGPRDMPRCGALNLLQKTPHYRGDPAETAASRLNVKFWTSVTACVTGGILLPYCFLSPNPFSNLFEHSRTILNLRQKNLSEI
jgi:hypothetical protein